MKITLVGYMAAGKTTVGKALAAQLKLPMYDLDTIIEQEEGALVNQIILHKGELYFRKLEKEILQKVLNNASGVVSVGGGTPCYYNNMDMLNEESKSFYLRLSPKNLAARLAGTQNNRPLIQHVADEALSEFVAKHLFERSAFYEKAHFILDANTTIPEIIENINVKLNNG